MKVCVIGLGYIADMQETIKRLVTSLIVEQ